MGLRILGIDTATDAVSAAVLRDGRLEAQFLMQIQKKHSVTLIPMLEQMLDDTGLELRQMDALCVTAGPGSFTGVRIGTATMSAFAFVLGLPVYEVSTLDALIALAPARMAVCALLDARRDQVYVKAQIGTDIVINESAQSLESVLGMLRCREDWLFTGDGAAVHKNRICKKMPSARFMPEAACWPAAAGACLCVMDGRAAEVQHDTLQPRYLRLPQAVRAKEESE